MLKCKNIGILIKRNSKNRLYDMLCARTFPVRRKSSRARYVKITHLIFASLNL